MPDCPVPVSGIATVALPGAFVDKLSEPVYDAADVGLNWICKVTVFPGLRVAGKDPPATEKPDPDMLAELIVSAAVPLDVRVRDFVEDDPSATAPKSREVTLRSSVGLTEYSVKEYVFVTEAAVAVSVSDWVDGTLAA